MITNLQKKRRDAIKTLIPIKSSDRYKYSITNIKKGGFISLNKELWQVKKVYRYLDVKWSSFKKQDEDYYVTELELFSIDSGKTIYVEWEYDDSLEIYETIKEIKLRDIKYKDKAIKKSDLEEIADEEEGDIIYNGVTYYYNDDASWAALFYEDNNDATPVRFYEFDNDNGVNLTIEVWYDDIEKSSREAFLSKDISKEKIEVIQLLS